MTEAPPSMDAAFRGLVMGLGLQRPDGRPLYEYRFDVRQFESIQACLRHAGCQALMDPAGQVLFVAYVAEWYRRVRTGGHWDWIAPLQSIGIKYRHADPSSDVSYLQIRDAVRNGLERWRRPVPSSGSLVLAVVGEAGFPAAAVRESARLSTWLRRAVLSAEAGSPVEEAVRQEAWRAPETVVQCVYPAAVRLCKQVVRLRALLPREHSRGGPDTVATLDASRPDWRAELPFDLDEQDVRVLVEDLVRARAGDEARALSVIRRLRRSDMTWCAWAEVTLAGQIEHRRLPPNLRADLQHAERIRVAPSGALAEDTRPICALERAQEEERDAWELRPLVRGFEARLALEAELRLVGLAGDRQIGEFTAPGGDPLTGPVIALQSSAAAALSEAMEFEVLGSSPARSTRPWLALAIAPAQLAHVRFDGQMNDLGSTDCGRCVIAFSGVATLETDGAVFRWRTGAERDETPRLLLVGRTVRGIQEQVFLGLPEVWSLDGETTTTVRPGELQWRPVGSREWSPVRSREPIGRVELAHWRGEELVAWSRCNIVPRGFALLPNVPKATLLLEGLAGASVAANAGRPLPCESHGASARIDLSGVAPGAEVRLRLLWTNPVELTLPDPLAEPMLLDPQGRCVQHGRLSVGRLAGYRLLSPEPRDLLFELRAPRGACVRVARSVHGLVPLRAHLDLLRAILGSGSELDAIVRLAWIGPGDWLVEIRWYDDELEFTPAPADARFEVLAQIFKPKLAAFSLVTPGAGVVEGVQVGTLTSTRADLESRLGSGPWLVIGESDEGRRFRPKLVPPEPGSRKEDIGELPALIEISDRTERRRALAERLARGDALTAAEPRLVVDLAVAVQVTEAPAAAVDILTVLCEAPEGAVYVLAACETLGERNAVLRLQDELPLLWCATSVRAWCSAFAREAETLASRLAAGGFDASYGRKLLGKRLVELADLQPALRTHVQITFLSTGAVADHFDVNRLCRRCNDTAETLANQFVSRRSEGAEPPSGLGLANALPHHRPLFERFQPSYADVIAAPLLMAAMAADATRYDPVHVAHARNAWLYDREYFEAAAACELLEYARAKRTAP